jgi:hypothetical protein
MLNSELVKKIITGITIMLFLVIESSSTKPEPRRYIYTIRDLNMHMNLQ